MQGPRLSPTTVTSQVWCIILTIPACPLEKWRAGRGRGEGEQTGVKHITYLRMSPESLAPCLYFKGFQKRLGAGGSSFKTNSPWRCVQHTAVPRCLRTWAQLFCRKECTCMRLLHALHSSHPPLAAFPHWSGKPLPQLLTRLLLRLRYSTGLSGHIWPQVASHEI